MQDDDTRLSARKYNAFRMGAKYRDRLRISLRDAARIDDLGMNPCNEERHVLRQFFENRLETIFAKEDVDVNKEILSQVFELGQSDAFPRGGPKDPNSVWIKMTIRNAFQEKTPKYSHVDLDRENLEMATWKKYFVGSTPWEV